MTENLHSLLAALQKKDTSIRRIICHPESFYTVKIQPKMKFGRPQIDKKGQIKQRCLTPPIASLKSIQRDICYFLTTVDLPSSMYGSIEELNNIDNACQHINNKFFLTIDIKNFFGSITHNQVYEVFSESKLPHKEARTLTNLTTYKGHLPQGAPTSPVLANLVFAKTALQLQAFAREHQMTFTTFLDDLTFSSKDDFKFLIPDLLKIIRENKFYPHHEKIHYRKDTCEITGLIVGKGKLKLTKEMQKEAATNLGVKAYALNVKKRYEEYLRYKKLLI